jgi:DNA-directed RNA polymerase subunit M/transcription elongation factor TFIIS
MKITADDNISSQCRNCGYATDPAQRTGEDCLVLTTVIRERTQAHDFAINEFTLNDPTLPHDTSIKCPNEACKSNTSDTPSDVIYIKYDPENLKYVYICTHCRTQWKSA